MVRLHLTVSPMPDDSVEPKRGAVPRFLWPPGIFLAVVATGVVMHWRMPAMIVPAMPARVLGVVVIIAAGALAVWAKRVMDAAGTHIHPWQPTSALVTTGPFAHTRNPLYTALCLLHLGIGLLVGGIWPVALTFVLLLALDRLIVVREERYLTRLIGEPYVDYRRRVPRWGWRMRAG
jgi:protein-S-isoprenylcysteine O-methyltransferase Ste14